jgi:hypothetical protein
MRPSVNSFLILLKGTLIATGGIYVKRINKKMTILSIDACGYYQRSDITRAKYG